MSKDNPVAGVIMLSICAIVWWNWPDRDEKPIIQPAQSSYTSKEVLGVEHQIALISTVKRYRSFYLSSSNDVQKGKYRLERGRSICEQLPSNIFSDWPALIKSVSTGSGGSKIDFIAFDIGDNVTLTHNDALFGKGFDENTPIYKAFLSGLEEGDPVLISGSFSYDSDSKSSDCFYEYSLSMSGGMVNPEYSIRLDRIEWPEKMKN